MLDLDDLDLDDLCTALEDNSYEHSWWFDPRSGEVRLHSPDIDEGDVDDLDEAGLVPIQSIAAHEAYSDMADFVARVGDQRVAARLERALGGPRPFRRFKDELYDHPELRDQWFAFNDVRMRRRAVEWLVDNGFIEGADAQRAIARCERQLVEAHTDTSALAARVAADLRALYGDRLADVLIFGSRARGEGEEDSDLDVLVVLDEVASPWVELRRMDELLWQHTEASGIVISALPVGRAEIEHPSSPVLVRAVAEAVPAP
jgi:predicted nucleotidyltransferase